MKLSIKYIFAISFLLFASGCNNLVEPEVAAIPDTISVNPETPNPPIMAKTTGKVEILKTGNLTPQSASNTKGIVDLVTDEAGAHFIRLSGDFTTNFHTGTVTFYLSESENLKLSETSSYELVATVGEPGAQLLKLPKLPNAKFSHGILWCGAAAIPFGFAKLK